MCLTGLAQAVQMEAGGIADEGGVLKVPKGDGFLCGQRVVAVESDDIFFAAHQAEADSVIGEGFVGQSQVDAPVQQMFHQLLGGTVQLADADLWMSGGKKSGSRSAR